MGCDIHSLVEVKRDGKWMVSEFAPFDDRNYMWFGFLADVRNRGLVPISAPRGLPEDASEEARDWFDWDYYGHSWLTVQELLGYDYDRVVADPYEDEQETTVRDLLGERFFDILDHLLFNADVPLTDVRVVFAFDS